MKRKLSQNKDLWFTCPKCNTEYDEYMEEVIPPELIRGTIEWANTPTKDKDRWDALTKLTIREEYETKKRKGEG